MKHSDYLFSECKACAEHPGLDSFQVRKYHWRKAALELQKQRDDVREAAKAVLAIYATLPGGQPKHGKWTALANAVRLAEREANG